MRVVSLLNSGADINTVGGWVCYYQCYDHVDHVDHVIQFKCLYITNSSSAYAEMYMYTYSILHMYMLYTCAWCIHKLVQLKIV